MTWSTYNPIKQMPFHYSAVPDTDVLIPTTDPVAWCQFSEYRHIYDKMFICASQELAHGPIGTFPTEYPVCVKPITNLMGGSVQSQVCHNLEQYSKIVDAGLFWSPYHMGEHYSFDFIMNKGIIVEYFIFRGEKLQHGAFDYWELVQEEDTPENAYRHAHSWLETNLDKYTGCVNVEMIGNYIIEAQLRMGDIDRLGDPWLMRAIHDLYASGLWAWQPNEYTPKTFYLAALFAQPNTTFEINKKLVGRICDNLTYYQIDDPDMYHTNPSHGNRVAIFCDENWEAVARARNIVAALFKPTIDGKYTDCLRDYEELLL